MSKVMICSIFRDSEEYLNRYFVQVSNQIGYPPQSLKYVFVEGDSKDNTYKRLIEWKGPHSNVVVKKVDTGKPYHGSVVHPERFKVLAQVANAAIEEMNDSVDYILWLESDLIIGNNLINSLVKCNKDIVAPFVYCGIKKTIETTHFYDTWAFRKNGQLFTAGYPFLKGLKFNKLFKVDSAGSVLLVKAEIVRKGARFTDKEAIVGFCYGAREMGYEVWAAPHIGVGHP